MAVGSAHCACTLNTKEAADLPRFLLAPFDLFFVSIRLRSPSEAAANGTASGGILAAVPQSLPPSPKMADRGRPSPYPLLFLAMVPLSLVLPASDQSAILRRAGDGAPAPAPARNYVVRFLEYRMVGYLLAYLKAKLGSHCEWRWVERRYPAASHPTDFGVLEIGDSDRISVIADLRRLGRVKDVFVDTSYSRRLLAEERPQVGKFGYLEKRPGKFFTSMSFEEGEDVAFSPVSNASVSWRRKIMMQRSQVTSLFGADRLWTKGFTGAKVKIAIFDTGIRSGHPHFRNIKVSPILGLVEAGKGRVAVYGDSSCLDGSHMVTNCYWLLKQILDFTNKNVKDPVLFSDSAKTNKPLHEEDSRLPLCRTDVNFSSYSSVVGKDLVCHQDARFEFWGTKGYGIQQLIGRNRKLPGYPTIDANGDANITVVDTHLNVDEATIHRGSENYSIIERNKSKHSVDFLGLLTHDEDDVSMLMAGQWNWMIPLLAAIFRLLLYLSWRMRQKGRRSRKGPIPGRMV